MEEQSKKSGSVNKRKFSITLKLIPVIVVAMALIEIVNIIIVRDTIKEEILEVLSDDNEKLVNAYAKGLISIDYKDTDKLQVYIDEINGEISANYVLYMENVDGTVYSIAHSNHDRIGIELDDAGSVAAAVDGESYCGYFSNDVYGLTLDVLTPIYENGQLQGALNIGIAIDEDTITEMMAKSTMKQSISGLIVGGLIIILTAIYIIICVVRPIKISVKSLEGIISDFKNENADLSKRVEVVTGDEVGTLAMGINNFIQILQELIGKIKYTSDEMQKANATINDGIIKSNGDSETISAAVQQLFASMESLEHGSNEMKESTLEIKDALSHIIKEANDGDSYISEMKGRATIIQKDCGEKQDNIKNELSKRKSELENAIESAKKVDEISNLTNDILSIASQTNLLALNASIEAARAGDAGRGFAVVADEISNLANNSAETANNIQNISADVVSAVENLMESAGGLIEKMEATIQEDYSSFKGMGNQYYSDAENVKEYFDEFSKSAENINRTMEEIINIIDNVVVGIKQCTVGTGNISDSIQELAGNMSEIRASSETNSNNFENLNREIQIFN